MKKSVVERLYEYLKEKYGIQGTETFDQAELGIPMKVEIIIPGVAKNNSEHKWVAFLEMQDSNKINALIIGHKWPNDQTAWSRYIEVKNNNAIVDFAWFKIINNTHLGHEYDFKSLLIFIQVLQEFSATI